MGWLAVSSAVAAAFYRVYKTFGFIITQVVLYCPLGLIKDKALSEKKRTTRIYFQLTCNCFVCSLSADLFFGKIGNDRMLLFKHFIKRHFEIFFAGEPYTGVKVGYKINKRLLCIASYALKLKHFFFYSNIKKICHGCIRINPADVQLIVSDSNTPRLHFLRKA